MFANDPSCAHLDRVHGLSVLKAPCDSAGEAEQEARHCKREMRKNCAPPTGISQLEPLEPINFKSWLSPSIALSHTSSSQARRSLKAQLSCLSAWPNRELPKASACLAVYRTTPHHHRYWYHDDDVPPPTTNDDDYYYYR